MTVLVKQRIPNPDTLEREEYAAYDVAMCHTYKGFDGEFYFCLQFTDRPSIDYNLRFYDVVIG